MRRRLQDRWLWVYWFIPLVFLLGIDRAVFGSVVAYSSGSCVFAKVENFVNSVNPANPVILLSCLNNRVYSAGRVQVLKVESLAFLMKKPWPAGMVALGTARRPSSQPWTGWL